jgi:CRISPR-associated protein Csd1
MILQALAAYYHRLIAQRVEGIAPYGYSPEKISYEIVLAPDGDVVEVNDIRDTSGKKPQARILLVPQPAGGTSNILPKFLWDKTSYVLGASATSKRVSKEHAAFKALHETVLADVEDEGLQALRVFLKNWVPEQFLPPKFPAEMLDANVVFRLDGENRYLHDREAAQVLRARLLADDEDSDSSPDSAIGMCLVSGESLPLARLHPRIKGVDGAQKAGASIVAFNADAYLSYKGSVKRARSPSGKKKKENDSGANAPISYQAAFAYTTALNYLLRRDAGNQQRLQIGPEHAEAVAKKLGRNKDSTVAAKKTKDDPQRFQTGDMTIVFWAEAQSPQRAVKAEKLLASVLNSPPEDGAQVTYIRRVLDGVAKGCPLEELDPELESGTRMYVLGLAPNAARLSIRFWLVDTLEKLTQHLRWHREDLRLEPSPWKTEPSVWRLALATAPSREGRSKSEDVPAQLAGELMRAILTGCHYPVSLLSNVIMRMRADGEISGVRVAICKAVIARQQRIQSTNEEEIPVSLNKQSTAPGYLLGRLFAVLESAQRSALGGAVNATIRDRYYGAASATPASIFPLLLRNAQNHLGKLRKEKPGAAINLEKDIREIIESLPENFPRSLKIEDQGRFAVGYYHQSQSHFEKAADKTVEKASQAQSSDQTSNSHSD